MDQDNPKARGWKHRTNKKKYNKGKPGGQLLPPKPKSALESNWDRYEQESTDNRVSSSTDFSILANAPITHGSHFQFKSDKDIASELQEPVRPSDLFKLDLNLLDKGLSTIPFNIRSGIDGSYFTENQQRIMTRLEDNIKDYSTYLSSYQIHEPDVVFGSEVEASESGSEADDPNSSHRRELSPRLYVSEEPPKTFESGDANLEQWLDDILDD